MSRELYRYAFNDDVPVEEVEASLVLAVLATEALHGEVQVQLDAAHAFDPVRRSCVIDATTAVGVDFNRLFTQFLRREFGPESFRVERVEAVQQPVPAENHV
jgi:hypothetical protein